jgi:hypothetical protein
MKLRALSAKLLALLLLSACHTGKGPEGAASAAAQVVTKQVEYSSGSTPLKGFVAYPATDEKRPAVLIVHEWWGLNDYVRKRAQQLAAEGYVAFAIDMFGGGNNALAGNETATNTYGITLRQAYVSWNEWLAGQTWSNFMDVAALPDAVDFIGPTDGTVFVRQAQLRYTKGPWSVSVENPQTTVTPYLGAAARFNTGDNVAPDITARWLTKGDWGHFTVAGLVRQFKFGDDTETGAAISVSGKFNLGANDDIRYAVNAGSGIGRYLALGLGSDVVQDENGDLHALDGYGAFAVSRSNVPAVIEYIARQKERHGRMSFEDEYRGLLRRAEIEFDERYLFD